MGTLKTAIDNARIKIRDTDSTLFTDNDDLIAIVNGILDQIYQTLVSMESNLVYSEGTIITVADTMEYTPGFTTRGGFLDEGSWVDGDDTYLVQVSEADKIKYDYDSTTGHPEAFYINEDGDIGYLYVPDDAYTVYHQYWKPFTAMSTYATDTLPWEGIWNRYIERMLVVELLIIQECNVSNQAMLAQIEYDRACNLTYNRGLRQRKAVSDMFTIDGI